jgi:hypothetical protein
VETATGQSLITNDRSFSLKKMNQVHKDIIRRIVLGMSNKDIAAELGVSEATVVNTKYSPIVQSQLANMNASLDVETMEVASEITKLAPIAAMLLKEVMLDGNVKPETRVTAARDILDRAGHAAVKRVQVDHKKMDDDKIAAIKEAAVERMRRAGVLADAIIVPDGTPVSEQWDGDGNMQWTDEGEK